MGSGVGDVQRGKKNITIKHNLIISLDKSTIFTDVRLKYIIFFFFSPHQMDTNLMVVFFSIINWNYFLLSLRHRLDSLVVPKQTVNGRWNKNLLSKSVFKLTTDFSNQSR